VALYVESLERADPRSQKVVACTHALLAKAAAMCSDAVRQAGETEPHGLRRGFDVTDTLAQVRDLIAPTLPDGVVLHVAAPGPIAVMADPQDVFRILFNLVHNAAGVARQSGALRAIRMTIETTRMAAVVHVADDGPGLPRAVRARLFRRGRSTTGGTGYGLAIARELAERNGGSLRLAEVSAGTCFVIELPRDLPCRVAPHLTATVQPQFA
jgi:signal transduction histidine kinase